MELLCHRCGATLVGDDTFCPNCGAPQLRVEEGAEGVQPFDAARPGPSEPLDASWRDAIAAALIFAIPVGLLSSNLLPFASTGFCLWVVGGSVAAVHLYRRRAATSMLNVRVGLRIGMVLGLLAGLLAATLNGLLMVVERYLLHNNALPDKEVQTIVELFMAPYAQNVQAQAEMHDIFAALHTPDGKAALVLFYFAFSSSIGIMIFSMIGGALGAKIFSIRRVGVKTP
jgi:hypothetical protein